MINYYKKSKKAFKNYIKENPYCTREEWDKYAHNNCLFSAFTIECHVLTINTLKILEKENIDKFEYLKSLFIIIPSKKAKVLKKLLKLNKNTKEEKIK